MREGRDIRLRRPGRRGEDDDHAAARRGHDARRRVDPDRRRRRRGGPGNGQAAHQLHAAAVRSLRGFDRRREHRILRRSVRDRSDEPGRARGAIAGGLGDDAVPQAPGGPAVGRHEAEARPDLLAHPHAQGAAARRADGRGRSGVAARLLAHPLLAARGGRHHRHRDVLSRRSRALHAARAAPRRDACCIATRRAR